MEFTKNLSLADLKIKTETAIKRERQATFELLQWLQEVDSRMAWHSWGFESLWKYLVHQGYSESSASERVQALRLFQKVPETGLLLKTGELSLTSAAKVQRFIRKEAKEKNNRFTQVESFEIVKMAARKTKNQVAQVLQEYIIARQPERKNEFLETKNKIEVSKETEQKLARMKEIRGADLSNDFLINMALNFWLLKNDPAIKYAKKPEAETTKIESTVKHRKKVEKLEQEVTAVTEVVVEKIEVKANENNLAFKDSSSQSRYIPAKVKKLVFRRDKFSCQKCGSRRLLQLDHIIRFKNNGKNTAENLRLLCSICNRAREIRLQQAAWYIGRTNRVLRLKI